MVSWWHLVILAIVIAWMVLTVYALVTAVVDGSRTVWDRVWWAVVILVLPLVGSLLWLVVRARSGNARQGTALTS